MTKTENFSPEFRYEIARLVVDQSYTVKAACDAMGGWQVHHGVLGISFMPSRPKAPQKGEEVTPEQGEIQVLKRKLRRLEEEKKN